MILQQQAHCGNCVHYLAIMGHVWRWGTEVTVPPLTEVAAGLVTPIVGISSPGTLISTQFSMRGQTICNSYDERNLRKITLMSTFEILWLLNDFFNVHLSGGLFCCCGRRSLIWWCWKTSFSCKFITTNYSKPINLLWNPILWSSPCLFLKIDYQIEATCFIVKILGGVNPWFWKLITGGVN